MTTVKVYLENGDSFVTKINGTPEDARKYYDGATLNMGTDADDLQKVEKIEILPDSDKEVN